MNTQNAVIQCSCKRDDGHLDFKTKFERGVSLIVLIGICHKCGKFRMSMRKKVDIDVGDDGEKYR